MFCTGSAALTPSQQRCAQLGAGRAGGEGRCSAVMLAAAARGRRIALALSSANPAPLALPLLTGHLLRAGARGGCGEGGRYYRLCLPHLPAGKHHGGWQAGAALAGAALGRREGRAAMEGGGVGGGLRMQQAG